MHTFELFQPASLSEAIGLLSTYGNEARIFAGGQDLLYRFKRRISGNPLYLVDIGNIEGLAGFERTDDGALVIRPLTRLGDLERSDLLRNDFPMLHSAVSEIASPQIRNLGTVGGNLFQDVWCWYLLENYDCWLNGGKYCYAVTGDHRYYHSVMGGRHCIASHPSDLAPALIAAEATAKIAGPVGAREVGVEALWPGFDWDNGRLRSHALTAGELLVEVKVPQPRPGARAVFLKYRLRKSWDFALGAVAASLDMDGDRCLDARVVLGGIGTHPVRASEVEQRLRGAELTETVIRAAAEGAAADARPLKGNRYKLALIKGLCRKALNQIRREGTTDGPG